MKTYTLQVSVGHRFEVFMLFPNLALLTFELYYTRENQPPKEIDTPEYIYSFDEIFQVKWANSMSVKQLLEHSQCIFHKSTVILTFGTDSERFSLESIYRNVKDVGNITFFDGNQEHNRRILRMFQPTLLTLESGALVNGCVPKDIVIQNFDLIRVPTMQNALDSLLMTNARSVETSGGRQSAKLLNKFLKLWAKGSNPRLDFLFLEFSRAGFQREELLKGLSCKKVPLGRVRLFKCSHKKEPISVSGGWDIKRFDGTQATIKVSRTFGAVEFELFGVSFLSKKTKGLVESLKLTIRMFHVEVNNNRLLVTLVFQHNEPVCFELQAHVQLQELETPGTFRICRGDPFDSWRYSLSASQFIDHLKFICHSPITTLKFGGNFEGFNLESIYKNVKGIKSLTLTSGNHELNRRVLGLFQPASIVLALLALVDFRVPRDILIQNFDGIRVTIVELTLDDLLMTNARQIDMLCHPISAKAINKFLKLWIKGSNPRLEWLYLRILGDFQNEEVFNGLKAKYASCDKEFKSSGNEELKKVIGGWVIRRFDGTKATITVRRRGHEDVFEIFRISLLSKKTKSLVKSLKMIARFFQVEITDRFQVYLSVTDYSPLVFRFYQVRGNEQLQELKTPARVRLFHEQKWIRWTNSMSVKELLDHLQFVFNSSGVSLFFKENCERFSLESVRKNVKDIADIGFLSGNHEHNRMVLRLFQPSNITLFAQALVNFRVPRYILIQNFDVVHVFAVQVALDDLLMTNVRFINLHSRVSMKTLNQFLKLWSKGSNTRLECLFLEFHGELQLEELFNGLKYQNASDGVKRFKTFGVETPVEIPNGRAIWRLDGTKATILASITGDLVKFGFYVWHEHCDLN
ncbi:unnamed protein product [Caenorhabditis brenneri]